MPATLIGPHTRVLGSIEIVGELAVSAGAAAVSGDEGAFDLVVEGHVEGSVRASGRLTLGRRAQITGEIAARDVRIAGRLDRSVRASGVIHLLPSAEVYGDLEAARVVIHDGAVFEGQVRLARAGRGAAASPTVAAAPPPPRSTPPAPPTRAREVPALSTPGRRRLQRRTP
jgi:cytoskeletal protein CcmA (bactofilin family)